MTQVTWVCLKEDTPNDWPCLAVVVVPLNIFTEKGALKKGRTHTQAHKPMLEPSVCFQVSLLGHPLNLQFALGGRGEAASAMSRHFTWMGVKIRDPPPPQTGYPQKSTHPQLFKADLLTFWFFVFGSLLVKIPKGDLLYPGPLSI